MTANIRLKGAPNFRDLGGYSTADGRRVRRGRLFRSEGLNDLAAEDYATLHGLGIRMICDLRSDFERSHRPTVWPSHMLPTTLVMDVNADLRASDSGLTEMLRNDPSEQGVLAMILHIYRFVPIALTKHLGNFFRAATQDENLPLILHCSAGKDRTGVLSAILLLVLGVPRETVVADYMKTHDYQDIKRLEQKVYDLMEPVLGIPPSRKTVEILSGVQTIYLEAAIESIDARYGSLENYLESAGVGNDLLAVFRSRLLE